MLYTISILLKSNLISGKKIEASWEENIILCRADNINIAKQKAEKIGRNLECEYKTINGDYIHWKYDGILSVYEIEKNNLDDDVIFSRYLRDEEVSSLKCSFKDFEPNK